MSLDKQLLDVEINIFTLQGASQDDLNKIVQSHALMQRARDNFLLGRLAWWEYLELCESHELNIDAYLNTVENNLNSIGIIV